MFRSGIVLLPQYGLAVDARAACVSGRAQAIPSLDRESIGR
jgi:hypothetical protein